MSNTATNFTSMTRSSYDTITLVTTDASANTYTTVFGLQDSNLEAPAAPVLATATTGGTVLAGTYNVVISYVDATGETLPSGATAQVTTGTTSTLTVDHPAAFRTATGWYAYVSSLAAPGVLTRQQTAGSPTAIGTNLTLSAPPTTSGAVPLTVETANGGRPVTSITSALFAS